MKIRTMLLMVLLLWAVSIDVVAQARPKINRNVQTTTQQKTSTTPKKKTKTNRTSTTVAIPKETIVVTTEANVKNNETNTESIVATPQDSIPSKVEVPIQHNGITEETPSLSTDTPEVATKEVSIEEVTTVVEAPRKTIFSIYDWCGLSIGWIQKKWVYESSAPVGKQNLLMNGIQIGVRVNPELWRGLGFDTGLFYEYCGANDCRQQQSDGAGGIESSRYDCSEHSLYFPMHAKYSMAVDNEVKVSLLGGLGFNYIMSRKVSQNADDQVLRHDYWKHYNMLLEIGASVRYRFLQLDITTSKGLNNWPRYHANTIYQERPIVLAATIYL